MEPYVIEITGMAVDSAESDEAVFDTTNINAVEHAAVALQAVVTIFVVTGSVNAIL